ncbi:MAG: hypothetical protein U0X91_01645 [Spirosomataceae bacterium]
MTSLSHFLIGCFSENEEFFGPDTARQNPVYELPEPGNSVHKSGVASIISSYAYPKEYDSGYAGKRISR